MITNACATQAILSILLNCEHSDFKLGKTLSDLKEFSSTLPPEVHLNFYSLDYLQLLLFTTFTDERTSTD